MDWISLLLLILNYMLFYVKGYGIHLWHYFWYKLQYRSGIFSSEEHGRVGPTTPLWNVLQFKCFDRYKRSVTEEGYYSKSVIHFVAKRRQLCGLPSHTILFSQDQLPWTYTGNLAGLIASAQANSVIWLQLYLLSLRWTCVNVVSVWLGITQIDDMEGQCGNKKYKIPLIICPAGSNRARIALCAYIHAQRQYPALRECISK